MAGQPCITLQFNTMSVAFDKVNMNDTLRERLCIGSHCLSY